MESGLEISVIPEPPTGLAEKLPSARPQLIENMGFKALPAAEDMLF